MILSNIEIQGIPAIIWGDIAERVYIFVHGKMSRKEDARSFAQKATQKGCQVISFDLPEHGDRKNDPYSCDIWNGVHDLNVIYGYVQQRWNHISLFASSLGAYFSLLAYKEFPLKKCLFLSPILDMETLIKNMMKWFDISEDLLEEKQMIQTPMGETLNWQYYCFVKKNPVEKWNIPTYILWGSKDNLTERDVVESFAERFHSHLTVLENSEHWFHTNEQICFLDKWLNKYI